MKHIDIYAQRKQLVSKLGWMFGGIIFGLMISKWSAAEGYDLGKARATAQLDLEQEIRWEHFQQHRTESCLAWWFNDSASNIKAAQFYMCQNKRKWR